MSERGEALWKGLFGIFNKKGDRLPRGFAFVSHVYFQYEPSSMHMIRSESDSDMGCSPQWLHFSVVVEVVVVRVVVVVVVVVVVLGVVVVVVVVSDIELSESMQLISENISSSTQFPFLCAGAIV